MTNENCLQGVKCPACGNEDTFRIQVTTMASVTDDGAEVEHGDMDWDDDSYAECANCCEHGKLSDFKAQSETPSGSLSPGRALHDALLEALESVLSHIDDDVPQDCMTRHFRDARDDARAALSRAKKGRP
jgi:ribosomal protein S12 methylthiotransferase accessory factor YcaO